MRTLRPLVALAGLAMVVALVPLVHGPLVATYGGADTRVLALEVAAACSLLLVSLVEALRVGLLVAFAGATWLVPEVAGVAGVGLVPRTLADAFAALLPVVVLAAVALRDLPSVRLRGPVTLVAVGGVTAAVARLALVDPFLEVDCWRTCDHNPFLVGSGAAGAAAELAVQLVVAVGVCWAATILAVDAARSSSRLSGRAAVLVPALLPVALVASLVAQSDSRAWATEATGWALFVLVQLAAIAWLATSGWVQWQRRALARRLVRDVDLLRSRSEPGALTDSLREAARDPDLQLAYWAPSREAYVGVEGRQVADRAAGPDRRVTTVTRLGQPIARLQHSARVDGASLDRALGPTLRLALENEQLRAAAVAELAELRSSRTRVVERAALERRRLERILHDGAQQRAISLALLVRMLAAKNQGTDTEASQRVAALTKALIAELRRVARGIYPAVLVDNGLRGGVLDLAEHADDLPVMVGDLPEGRYAGTVETTAYLVVRAGIDDARARGATRVCVHGDNGVGMLRLEVEDDGPRDGGSATFDLPGDLVDQVTALGGRLLVDALPKGRRVEVELPCVW